MGSSCSDHRAGQKSWREVASEPAAHPGSPRLSTTSILPATPRLAPTSHTHPRGPPRCQGVIWVRWWEPTKRLLTTQLLLKVIQERAKVYSAGTLVHSAVLHIWKLLDLQSSHQKEKNCNCVWWRMLTRFIVAIIL